MKPLITALLLLSPLLGLSEDPTHVLMLGNSYTAGTVQHIRALFNAESADIQIEARTPGGKTLAYHLDDPKSLDLVKSKKWDILIIQGQSLEAAVSPASTRNFQEKVAGFAALARKQGIPKLMLFQTWGRQAGHKKLREVYPDFTTMNTLVTTQYTLAGKENGATVIPVGEAFAAVHKKDPDLFASLYKPDGSHPSARAGYLAACVFYGAITGKSPLTVKWAAKLDEKTAAALKTAASQAHDNHQQ